MRLTIANRKEAERILREFRVDAWEDAASRRARVRQRDLSNRILMFFGLEPEPPLLEEYSDEWISAKLDAIGFPRETGGKMEKAEWNVRKEPMPYDDCAGIVMSNFDHEIDTEVAEALLSGDCWGSYSGRDFYGKVWFDVPTQRFKCEVMRYGSHVATAIAPTLEGIMQLVSDTYGWD